VDVANIHVGWSAELTQKELWDIKMYEGMTPHLNQMKSPWQLQNTTEHSTKYRRGHEKCGSYDGAADS
jgi:hypothetical protein